MIYESKKEEGDGRRGGESDQRVGSAPEHRTALVAETPWRDSKNSEGGRVKSG